MLGLWACIMLEFVESGINFKCIYVPGDGRFPESAGFPIGMRVDTSWLLEMIAVPA